MTRSGQKFFIDLAIMIILSLLLNISQSDFVVVALYLICLLFLNTYKTMYSFFDAFEIAKLLLVTTSFFVAHSFYTYSPPTTILLFYLLAFISLLAVRVFIVLYRNSKTTFRWFSKKKRNSAIIIGAGEATKIFLNQKISLDFKILGIFDDNLSKKGSLLSGINILGPVTEIKNFLQEVSVDQILYMIPSVSISKHKKIFEVLQKNYPKIKFLSSPSLNDINGGFKSILELSNISIFDLNQNNNDINFSDINLKKIKGKTVLVTGGAGSIGGTLVEKLLRLNVVSSVVVIDSSEFNIYRLTESLASDIASKKLITYLCDFSDVRQLNNILRKHKPVFIYHAAAYKHVNLLETYNLYNAINNNCLKTFIFVRELIKHSFIKSFVLVSTDKSVNPTNIMGLTKRIVEVSLNEFFRKTNVDLLTVRFGNVIGSDGSVFHKFLHQIKNYQKITLTDLSVKRYFMNISQAANLIIKTSLIGKAGNVYILNMGEPIKIYDFIVSMINKHGDKDQINDIKIIGLMPGEKINEELYYDHENVKALDDTIFVGTYKKLNFDINAFESFFENIDVSDEIGIRRYINSIKIF